MTTNEWLDLASGRGESLPPYGMSKTDLDAMDAHLVRAAHPLAFEAGTQHSRFAALVRSGWRAPQ